MRYVIVSVTKGNAGEFNNNLRKNLVLNPQNFHHTLQ